MEEKRRESCHDEKRNDGERGIISIMGGGAPSQSVFSHAK